MPVSGNTHAGGTKHVQTFHPSFHLRAAVERLWSGGRTQRPTGQPHLSSGLSQPVPVAGKLSGSCEPAGSRPFIELGFDGPRGAGSVPIRGLSFAVRFSRAFVLRIAVRKPHLHGGADHSGRR